MNADDFERLARALHTEYLLACVARGDTSATNASLVEWADLPSDLRRANFAAAADVQRKLALVRRKIVASAQAEAPAAGLAPDEVEYLAQLEHERWVASKRADGWRVGPQRDRVAKEHPDMVAWADLGPAEQDLDRHAVRRLPALLDEAGYLVIPSGA
jgi:hypothetical protein